MKTRFYSSTEYNQKMLQKRLFIIGMATFLTGLLYYIYFRPLPSGFSWLTALFYADIKSSAPLLEFSSQTWHYSTPSFLHTLSFCLFTLTTVKINSRNIRYTATFWLSFSVIFEFSQWVFSIGTFDWFDLLAAITAIAIFIYLANVIVNDMKVHQKTQPIKPTTYRPPALYLLPVILVGLVSTIGSYDTCYGLDAENNCYGPKTNNYEPIYMSFDELRNSAIYNENSRPLESTGKIYLYKDYLFVNSPNKGVHIYNNLNPEFPVKIGFINIPGNVDIAISQDYLYVDSYIDLVTIDIRDIQTPAVINRKINIFPYDPYQNVPEYIQFNNIDQSKGVVVGYTQL